MLLPVALTTTGAAAIINLWLGVRVSQLRLKEKIFVGDGGNQKLVARMRAQLNFAEYAPIALLLIALIEFGAGSQFWLWIVAALFLFGRLLHALGMDGWRIGRQIGIISTMLTLLGLGIYAIWLAAQYGNPLR
ncbi:MAPEG family protein [Sphingomonas sp. MMS12-HWE2-04]|uniref:MAPEG family protein n=1 Tax=Sphingomonas sp. MMS12-HWE2-04 TaxID=3234199 RepID=UPI00384B9AFE